MLKPSLYGQQDQNNQASQGTASKHRTRSFAFAGMGPYLMGIGVVMSQYCENRGKWWSWLGPKRSWRNAGVKFWIECPNTRPLLELAKAQTQNAGPLARQLSVFPNEWLSRNCKIRINRRTVGG